MTSYKVMAQQHDVHFLESRNYPRQHTLSAHIRRQTAALEALLACRHLLFLSIVDNAAKKIK